MNSIDKQAIENIIVQLNRDKDKLYSKAAKIGRTVTALQLSLVDDYPERFEQAIETFNGYWANDYHACDNIADKYGYNRDAFKTKVYEYLNNKLNKQKQSEKA